MAACVAVLLVLTIGLDASAQAKKRLAVLNIESDVQGIGEVELVYLTEKLRGEARSVLSSAEWAVMDQQNMTELLDANATDLCRYEEGGQCLIDLGRAIQAHVVVAGTLVRLDGEHRLLLRSYDIGSGEILRSAEAKASSLGELADQLGAASADLLFDQRTGSGTGAGPVDGAIDGGSDDWSLTSQQRHVIRFHSDPPRAAVSLDGDYLCETPCSKALSEGIYRIAMVLPRYDAVERTLQVAGAADVTETLAPQFGWLSVATNPSGLALSIDGEPAGASPIERREMPPGVFEVVIADDAWFPDGHRVTVTKGQASDVSIEARPKIGGLAVEARDGRGNDLMLEILVDGKPAGTTPWTGEVQVGEHTVQVGSCKADVRVRERTVEPFECVVESQTTEDTSDGGTSTPAHSLLTSQQIRWSRVCEEHAYQSTDELQEQIAKGKELLRNESYVVDESLKAELLMRLAVAYEVMADHEWCEESEDAPDGTAPDRSRSTQYWKKAISSYQNLLTNYQSFGRLDEVLFRMAMALEAIDERKEALQSHTKLVKEHQTSPYVPDAYNAIGEYYFDNKNMYKALQAYKKSAAFRDSGVYTFALYKAGWCYWNVGEEDRAVATMETVISETDRVVRQGGNPDPRVKAEAVEALDRFGGGG